MKQKATLPAICNLLQEVAGNHAQQLQFDITDLQEDKLTWVLHRLFLKMDRFPEWRDTITIETWPSSGDGLRAYRDFLIWDAEGTIIGKSLSYWLMMNIENRRPTRIPKKIMDMAPKNIEHVLPITDFNIPDIPDANHSEAFDVRKTDLDLNRHVNYVHFIEWALSCLPDNTQANIIDIKFLAEAVQDDTVIAEILKNHDDSNPSFYHQLKRKRDQKVLAQAQSRI